MGCDSLDMLRTAMAVAGIIPKDWNECWKLKLFSIYATFLDFHYIYYFFGKLAHVLIAEEYFEGGFELMILMCLEAERYYFRWNGESLLSLMRQFKDLSSSEANISDVEKCYIHFSNRICKYLGFVTFSGHFQLIANYVISCDFLNIKDHHRPCRKYLMELWYPFDQELNSLGHKALFVFNFFETIVTTFILFISMVLVPILVIRMSARFKIIAVTLEKRLQIPKYDVWVGPPLLQIREESLLQTIKKHQYILDLARDMSDLFRAVVFFKLVFMTLPMILVALSISQLPFGGFQFNRHLVLLIVPLSEIFILCYFGEELTAHEFNVHHGVYLSQWYRMCSKDKQLLQMVGCRALQPVRLEVWPYFVPASLETFLKVCQLSYSVYSVLVVISSKDNQGLVDSVA